VDSKINEAIAEADESWEAEDFEYAFHLLKNTLKKVKRFTTNRKISWD